MQGGRAHILGDQDGLDPALAGKGDDFAQQGKIFLVRLVDCDGDEFEGFRLGLIEKGEGLGKSKVTPALAKGGLHILDQQIKVLHIPTDGAGKDRCRIGLLHHTTRH